MRDSRCSVCWGVLAVLAVAGSRAVVSGGGDGVLGRCEDGAGAGLSAVHRAMIDRLESGAVWGRGGAATCFAPGTPEWVVDAFEAAMDRAYPDRFQQTTKWLGGTAMGGTPDENEPLTLTYSFVPDGTTIPSGIGEASGTSDLFSYLDGIYGDTQTWQDLFAEVFARWAALAGVSYVHETNDDGAGMFGNAGQIGFRGDIRIGGKFIDGSPNPNILAYNMFPTGGGDMVLDTGDTYYLTTTQNSRRLRNVAGHEHGHGLGMLHVCPLLSQKLMEPRITTTFDGPQQDDIRNAQDYYGDVYEPNETAIIAEDFGVIPAGTTLEPWVVPSPAVSHGSLLSLNEDNSSPYANDEDWYQFTTDGHTFITVTVSPIGSTYQDNPQSCPGQTSNCCSGVTVNTLTLADLSVQLRRWQGSSILATANANGLGQGETIAGFEWPEAETFQVRVYSETDGFIEPQLYSLSITSSAPTAPGAFGLVSPTPGQQDVETGPILDWEASVGADEFLVEVDDDSGFGSPEVSQVLPGGGTGVDLSDGTLAYDTEYSWRVTATNAQGSTPSTPAVSGFRTMEDPNCNCNGDFDGDCDTDVFDFGVLAEHFGQSVPSGEDGDMDGDGDVDVFDFAYFTGAFGCPE